MNIANIKGLLVAALLMPVSFVGLAQNNFKLEVEQSIDNGNLLMDFYIQKTNGSDFPLGSSNFAVYLDNTALNLTQMTIEPTAVGPYDATYDPNSYVNMSLGGHNYNFSNLSVLKLTSGSGSGQMVTSTRTRIGRVKMPIVDACQYSTPTWIIAPVAINDFAGNSIKANADFVAPAPFALCTVPTAPVLSTAGGVVEFCEGSNLTINSDITSGTLQWYKDGVAISGATGTSFTVTEGGVYTAEAVNCICKSAQAATVSINMLPLPVMPVIQVNTDELTTTATGNLQWYLNGNPISGATSSTYTPVEDGSYTVSLTNSCGSITSDPVVFTMPTGVVKNFANAYQFGAYPNPYNGETKISYTLKNAEKVKIDVYNSIGQYMLTLVNENKDAGQHSVKFSAKSYGYATGVYTVKMYIGKNIASVKLVEVE